MEYLFTSCEMFEWRCCILTLFYFISLPGSLYCVQRLTILMRIDIGACLSLCLNSILCVFLFIVTQVGASGLDNELPLQFPLDLSLVWKPWIISHEQVASPIFINAWEQWLCIFNVEYVRFPLFLLYIVCCHLLCLQDILRLEQGFNSNRHVDKHCLVFIGLSLVIRLSLTVKCQT